MNLIRHFQAQVRSEGVRYHMFILEMDNGVAWSTSVAPLSVSLVSNLRVASPTTPEVLTTRTHERQAQSCLQNSAWTRDRSLHPLFSSLCFLCPEAL